MYKTSCITDGGKRKILKGFPKETIELSEEQPQALVSFKKYMPPPLPYFKVNIYPFPLPHFSSILFAYL
jgi:hypothetical protein